MSEFVLFQKIIELSESKQWELARKEWILEGIGISKEECSCLCGHSPIKELCYLTNNLNNNRTIVGNCCVKKFFEEKNQDKIFNALKNNKLNKSLIELSFTKKIIQQNEFDFLLSVWRKRKLSFKQQEWYESLKKRIKRGFENGQLR